MPTKMHSILIALIAMAADPKTLVAASSITKVTPMSPDGSCDEAAEKKHVQVSMPGIGEKVASILGDEPNEQVTVLTDRSILLAPSVLTQLADEYKKANPSADVSSLVAAEARLSQFNTASKDTAPEAAAAPKTSPAPRKNCGYTERKAI